MAKKIKYTEPKKETDTKTKTKEKTEKVPHYSKPRLFFMRIKKWMLFLAWFFVLLVATVGPYTMAQNYEMQAYSLVSNTKNTMLASHYTNAINFGYNVAALATVLLVYLIVKHLYHILKTPSEYQQYKEKLTSKKK